MHSPFFSHFYAEGEPYALHNTHYTQWVEILFHLFMFLQFHEIFEITLIWNTINSHPIENSFLKKKVNLVFFFFFFSPLYTCGLFLAAFYFQYKTLFSVSDCSMQWFDEGLYITVQFNKYETAPNFIQLNKKLTSDCFLI